jgi:hypothetical protein
MWFNHKHRRSGHLFQGRFKAVVDADHFVRGLKRHWLLRSAFREKGRAKPQSSSSAETLTSPKQDAR